MPSKVGYRSSDQNESRGISWILLLMPVFPTLPVALAFKIDVCTH